MASVPGFNNVSVPAASNGSLPPLPVVGPSGSTNAFNAPPLTNTPNNASPSSPLTGGGLTQPFSLSGSLGIFSPSSLVKTILIDVFFMLAFLIALYVLLTGENPVVTVQNAAGQAVKTAATTALLG